MKKRVMPEITLFLLMRSRATIMPSITNEVVTLVKDTSMAFTVSYQEMFTIGKQIANSETSFVPFLVAGVFYFVFNAVVDFVMGRVEKRMSYYK